MDTIEKLQQIDKKVEVIFGALFSEDKTSAEKINAYLEQKGVIDGIKNTLSALMLEPNNNTAIIPFCKAIVDKVNDKLITFGSKYLTVKQAPKEEVITEEPIKTMGTSECSINNAKIQDCGSYADKLAVEPTNLYMVQNDCNDSSDYRAIRMTSSDFIKYLNLNFTEVECPNIYMAGPVHFESKMVRTYTLIK